MDTFLYALLTFLLLLVAALLGVVIYSAFNTGLGTEHITEPTAIVTDKEIDVVTTMVLVGKVMVPQTTTHYYVTIQYEGKSIKFDVHDKDEYNSVVKGDYVYAGYTIGYFDHKPHFHSVWKKD